MKKKKIAKEDRRSSTTADGGIDYRTMADILTANGMPMNHASARNYILRAMKKLASGICKEMDIKVTSENLERIAASPLFQSAIYELLQERK
jgi:hypothetical protein